MKCPSCKSPLQPTARFCGLCGASVLPEAPETLIGGLADPFIGVVLNNRFKIEGKLGEGGFGAVYWGTQTATGRKVALKVLHPQMASDQHLVARFRREGQVLCTLRDAHTVTTYDFDQTSDGLLYIAMELLEGLSLHTVFRREAPLDWRRVFKVIAQMCSSLSEAHGRGIVHRDLKPENIYLENRPGDPEFVKILDFGIAKVVQGDPQTTPQLTATGQTLGTLEYMSPEQLMGKDLDGRSDIYGLGVVAYEMIAGRLPFPEATKSPGMLITAQLRQVPIPPSQANPSANIPPEVDRIILKMLEKERDNRYSDVNDVRQACLEAVGGGQQWAREPSGQHQAAAQTTGSRPKAVATPYTPPSVAHGHGGLPNAGGDEGSTFADLVRERMPLIVGLMVAAVVIGGLVALALT